MFKFFATWPWAKNTFLLVKFLEQANDTDTQLAFEWLSKTEFDAQKWLPTYDLATPKDWGIERFPIPINFAPEIPYEGVEVFHAKEILNLSEVFIDGNLNISKYDSE